MVDPTLGEKRRKKRCINIGRENDVYILDLDDVYSKSGHNKIEWF